MLPRQIVSFINPGAVILYKVSHTGQNAVTNLLTGLLHGCANMGIRMRTSDIANITQQRVPTRPKYIYHIRGDLGNSTENALVTIISQNSPRVFAVEYLHIYMPLNQDFQVEIQGLVDCGNVVKVGRQPSWALAQDMVELASRWPKARYRNDNSQECIGDLMTDLEAEMLDYVTEVEDMLYGPS